MGVIKEKITKDIQAQRSEGNVNSSKIDQAFAKYDLNVDEEEVKNKVHAHSFRLHSSHIPTDHPLVKRCVELGLKPYGSPTLSDQALMPWPSFKLGPGESARSHSANEFICLSEMRDAFSTYQKLLQP